LQILEAVSRKQNSDNVRLLHCSAMQRLYVVYLINVIYFLLILQEL